MWEGAEGRERGGQGLGHGLWAGREAGCGEGAGQRLGRQEGSGLFYNKNRISNLSRSLGSPGPTHGDGSGCTGTVGGGELGFGFGWRVPGLRERAAVSASP